MKKRGIDYASPKQIADMIRSYLRDYSFNLNQYRKLMKVIEEVNQLPRNTEIYLPHTE